MPKKPKQPATLAGILADVYFTPTQVAIVRMLSDGESHAVKDVLSVLNDELASKNALQFHISAIRKKIAPYGHDIVCTFENRRTNYRYIVTLPHLLSITN